MLLTYPTESSSTTRKHDGDRLVVDCLEQVTVRRDVTIRVAVATPRAVEVSSNIPEQDSSRLLGVDRCQVED